MQQLENSLPLNILYSRLHTTPEAIVAFCQKWSLAEFAVFGSVLRDDFRVDGDDPSDIDVLLSYVPGANMSLLRRVKMKSELENLFQQKVDLLLAIEVIESHNWMRRKQILESKRVMYAQG